MTPTIVWIVALLVLTRALLTLPHWRWEGRSIRIRARRNLFSVGFVCFWLYSWAVALIEVVRRVAEKPQFFLFFWLCGWLLGGVFFALWVIRQLFGSEVLELDGDVLRLRREIGGLAISSEVFRLGSIRNLRVVPLDEEGSWEDRITFDYCAETVRFGDSLDDSEAKQMVDYLGGLALSPS